MNLSVGAKTDPGRRPNNEDQLLVLDVKRHRLRADGVLVIADGMGGRNFGERASEAAVQAVGETLTEMLDGDREPGVDVGDALGSALRKANSRIYELSHQDEESRGMGTTCVAAVVEGDKVYVAHAGDSRAYRWRHQQLVRLTDDHSYVAEQVRAGVLTEENAQRSRFRNVITRAVGIEPTITPDVAEHDLQAGDALLLCTDGLTNMVPEAEIAKTLEQASSAQAAADRLVHLANLNGGRDNITAIVARMEIGTRTQRMRANDLAQIVRTPEAAETAPAPADAPRVRNAPPDETQNGARPPDAAPAPSEESREAMPPPRPLPVPGEQARPSADREMGEQPLPAQGPQFGEIYPGRRKPGRAQAAGLGLLALLAAALLASTLVFGQALTRAGYRLQAQPPFAVKPAPPPAPKPPDLAHVGYGKPSLLSAVPVSGDVLTHSPADGSLTVVTLTGNVLVLTPGGATLYKYALPKRHLTAGTGSGSAGIGTPAPAGSSAPPAGAAGPQRLHMAIDPQGDLYISDSVLRTIEKYSPNGEFLRYIAQGPHLLKDPQAIAAGADGSVYVVDAQRLEVIHAVPAAAK